MNDKIKQDINFLEYPLWMQSLEKPTGRVMIWKDRDGYTFESTRGTPSKVDMLFLYFILGESQSSNWSEAVTFSRYKIFNACGMNVGQKDRARLVESLEIWKRVTVSFSGTFYTGTEYQCLEFGIIDGWGIRENDKKIQVKLNSLWLEKIKQSEFFKYISFTQMKSLRSPLALRLYEILIKTFYKRSCWEIDIHRLAEKIPMKEKYVAHITPKIESAVKRIREKTELNVTVKKVKQERGKGKFIFKLSKSRKPLQQELFTDQNMNLNLLDEFRSYSTDMLNSLSVSGNIYAQKVLKERNKLNIKT
jgi:hypothetical protein